MVEPDTKKRHKENLEEICKDLKQRVQSMRDDHHMFLTASSLSSRAKVKAMLQPVGKILYRNPRN